VGVGRDIAVTAFQSASGLVNLITPTSGVLMGALTLGRIPYDRFLKHIWKFLLVLGVIIAALLALAVVM
ncbi:MAG: YfcC family protein, partial [Clostridia bacterium]|nr:YfcC family protein [Clostridia bacterium]